MPPPRHSASFSLRRLTQLLLWAVLPLALVALLAACAPTATLNALAVRDAAAQTQGVAYGPLPRHGLDVYRPTQAAPAAGWPVVVFFYGGSWTNGERADYKFVGTALAARGVLTLVADYRLYPEVRYPDFLNDCALAAAYGLEQARALGGDPKRVFVMGHSAGAYNAAMLALDPRWLKGAGHSPSQLAGWIGLAGPYDFLPMTNRLTQPVFFHPNYPQGSQPVDYVGKTSPRAFVGAALSDNLVDPQRNSVALATKLQAAGAPVELRLYGRVNHVTLAAAFAWPLRWLAPVLDDVVAFIAASPETP
ncbi:MAG: esterase [Methylibium sp. NZG]|nr:MAG: esterase [Methylibium sp. NZG]